MISYLDLANTAYIADANFHFTECGVAKLLQEYCNWRYILESLISKSYIHIKH